MPTNLPNRAQLTYTFGENTDTALSNQTNTTLLDQFTMTATKLAVNDEVRAGGDAAYVIRLENTGSGALYSPTVTDDLGTGNNPVSPLTYVDGSALFYLNGNAVAGTAVATGNQVVFSAPSVVLQPGDNLIVVYAATTSENFTVPITNTAEATVNTGSATGETLTITATATINPQTFASVSIFKAADSDTVVSGDTLTYTFTLTNMGNQDAESIEFVDAFPPEFTVTSVSYTVDGVTVPVPATDYTIAPPNTLILPADTSSLVIGVPAATAEGPGVTVITVTGTIA